MSERRVREFSFSEIRASPESLIFPHFSNSFDFQSGISRTSIDSFRDRETDVTIRLSDRNVFWLAEDSELSSEESTALEGICGSLSDDAIPSEKVLLRLPSGKNENCFD